MNKRRVLFVVAGLLLAGGCVSDPPSVREKDGQQYGVTDGVFRGRWWSYYERGTSYLAGGFHEEAAADFQQALKGRSRDTWRARTYGLHFVEYFPARELGVCEVTPIFRQGPAQFKMVRGRQLGRFPALFDLHSSRFPAGCQGAFFFGLTFG